MIKNTKIRIKLEDHHQHKIQHILHFTFHILTIVCQTHLDWNYVFKKGDKPCSLALVREVEIHPITKGFNTQTATMSSMFQNKLFQIKKSALMSHTLSDLHQTLPAPLSKFSLAFNTLLVPDNENNHKALLQDGASLYFLLNGQSDFQSHGMRLRPDPASIDQVNFCFAMIGLFEAIYIFEA